MVEYNERVRGLEEEKSALGAALDRLRQAQVKLTPISDAKLGVLARDVNLQLSLGNVEKAEAKKIEIEKIKNHALNLSREIEQTRKRLSELEQERVRLANQVLADLYATLRVECLRRLEDAIDFLEATWAGLHQFGLETGAEVKNWHLRNLTLAPFGKDRFLWEKIHKWV
jgi:flagellar biosynthesis chaperone FliJ